MNVTLTYTELYDTVERSLSVIGKRSTDDNGNRLFADITLGSREVPLIYDYFRQAVIDLATELSAFITETEDSQQESTVNASVQISFWTDQNTSQFLEQVTRSGQYLYKYNEHLLYVSAVTYPFNTVSPGASDLFTHEGNYYRWNNGLTQLTAEQVEALADEEKEAAHVLSYFNVNPATITENSAGIYAYYNNNVYSTQRVVAFVAISPQADILYYAPNGMAYLWQYGTMQRTIANNDGQTSVTLSFPTNHESSLNTFITKSCKAYCVSYALHSWFTVTAPRLSDKYLKDCTRQLAAVIRLSHEKKAPEAPATSYEQISGTVTQN